MSGNLLILSYCMLPKSAFCDMTVMPRVSKNYEFNYYKHMNYAW